MTRIEEREKELKVDGNEIFLKKKNLCFHFVISPSLFHITRLLFPNLICSFEYIDNQEKEET